MVGRGRKGGGPRDVLHLHTLQGDWQAGNTLLLPPPRLHPSDPVHPPSPLLLALAAPPPPVLQPPSNPALHVTPSFSSGTTPSIFSF
ncbi:hypothetical protein Pmani_026727 [Petrolisthes manimaculis]|uniref:Uncharacterized protein n=1 Tax=Petrolisthes manimaculis TaxID=1843537 RepID=A0AAE1TZU7_9EUCA|nr:hypothetical protein Pmani_026727 [Petrolisthes manimaculis]